MAQSKKRNPRVYPDGTAEALAAVVRNSEEPISIKLLPGMLTPPVKIPGTDLQRLLAPEVAAGKLFGWGAAKSPEYWHKDPAGEARERIAAVAGEEVLARAEVSRRAAELKPSIMLPAVRKALGELLKDGVLREVRVAETKVLVNVLRPERFLQQEIGRLCQSFGKHISPDRIESLLVPESVGEPRSTVVEPEANRSQVGTLADQMFEAMNRIAFSPGTTVTFYRLRQQPELAQVPKEIFDAAALLLQSERKAFLSVHDHAAGLSEAERERFVTDGLGTYYVSIYAR